ncbi:branched-chain amino acid export protein small subunit [Kocuria tytonicola]|uniref:AzlD domain-containing protein n=1 Tax=Kocuria tytonicola TaxID=2055946 RepID=UPI000EF867AB|nr:AzlD domain-containing protein [Kocuria tytonicola]RLZ04296.1 branched-chain amino acid export protein small subunit [Kocuria tytonicola]
MIAAILVCAAVTFALRFLPMQVAHRFRNREDLTEFSTLLPAGLMLILVAYTLVEADSGTQLSRLVLAAVVSVLVNLASKNFLISFLAGFAAYSLAGLVLS